MKSIKEFLKCAGDKIVGKNNRPVSLRGVNVGGWLLMEGYILQSLNIAQKVFKKDFVKTLGAKELLKFEKVFRDNFIQESDFKTIKNLGFNVVRVPFHYDLIEKKAYQYDVTGLSYLDKALSWAKKYKLWVILDLHAACGAQNHDWHSDSTGDARLWQNRSFQKRTVALWGFLANRYKGEECIAGYDLLNEAVTKNVKQLNNFYQECISRIRSADKNHIIFVEGNNWATDLHCLDDFEDDNLALSVHFYEPLNFTFNFEPHLRYPKSVKNGIWNKGIVKKILLNHKGVSKKRKRPIFVGEFGVNARQGLFGETKWLEDTLSCFNELGFHWTYWTFKAVKNSVFPDGIFSYLPNAPWIQRHGPKMGWDNYKFLWKHKQKDIVSSWKSDFFTGNDEVLKVLKNAVRNN